MTLLLVAALSTATFAWYRANSEVRANTAYVVSARSSSASIAIDTSNRGRNSGASSIDLVMSCATTALKPAAPHVSPTSRTTTYKEFKDSFKTANVNNSGNFLADGADAPTSSIVSATPENGSTANQNYFVVVNTDGVNSTNVTVNVTIEHVYIPTTDAEVSTSKTYYTRGDDGKFSAVTFDEGDSFAEGTIYYEQDPTVGGSAGKDMLKVAVFAEADSESATDETTKYIGTWSAEGASWGYIKRGANQLYDGANSTSAATAYDCVTSAQPLNATATSIAPLGAMRVKIVSWFDGVKLGSDQSGAVGEFSIVFNGETQTTTASE